MGAGFKRAPTVKVSPFSRMQTTKNPPFGRKNSFTGVPSSLSLSQEQQQAQLPPQGLQAPEEGLQGLSDEDFDDDDFEADIPPFYRALYDYSGTQVLPICEVVFLIVCLK